MPLPRLESWMARKPERKISAIVAGIATLTVIISSSWTIITRHEPETTVALSMQAKAVVVTEKPVIAPHQAKKKNDPPAQNKVSATPAVQTSSTKKPVTAKAAGNFYVQAGAFKQKKLALILQKRLMKQHKSVELHLKSGLHIIWVGPVANKEKALQLQRDILEHEKIRGFIVTGK